MSGYIGITPVPNRSSSTWESKSSNFAAQSGGKYVITVSGLAITLANSAPGDNYEFVLTYGGANVTTIDGVGYYSPSRLLISYDQFAAKNITSLHSPGAIGDVTPGTGAFTTLTTTGIAGLGGSADAGYGLTIKPPTDSGKAGFIVYANNLTQNAVFGWQGVSGTSDFDVRTVGQMFIGSSGSNPLIMFTGGTIRMTIKASGVVNIASIPTSASGLSSGDVYSNAGILTIVP